MKRDRELENCRLNECSHAIGVCSAAGGSALSEAASDRIEQNPQEASLQGSRVRFGERL